MVQSLDWYHYWIPPTLQSSWWRCCIHLYDCVVVMGRERWKETSFLAWNALKPVFFFCLCCHFLLLYCSARGPIDYVVHLLEEQEKKRERKKSSSPDRRVLCDGASSPWKTKVSMKTWSWWKERWSCSLGWHSRIEKTALPNEAVRHLFPLSFPLLTCLLPSSSAFYQFGGGGVIGRHNEWAM